MRQGDLVTRRSYGGDVLFRIESLQAHRAILKGTDFRLLADSPLPDLTIVPNPEDTEVVKRLRAKVSRSFDYMQNRQKADLRRFSQAAGASSAEGQKHYFELPGKVLHLDGDVNYLKKSMQLYQAMRVPSYGMHVHEAMMADVLQRLLPQVRPDIVVITGHDGVLKQPIIDLHSLDSYKNSQHFVAAVQVARSYQQSRDSMLIIAGACQSHFEALVQAGANFASSPSRILIHALDPVYVAIKSSYTSYMDPVNLQEIINGTISGNEGMGGVETLGKFRLGLSGPSVKAVDVHLQSIS